MVRLEMDMFGIGGIFQANLHSSMVRLEIDEREQPFLMMSRFTFQYG